MGIQIDTRKLAECPDLVLYVDIQEEADPHIPQRFVAEVYEGDEKTITAFPSLPISNSPIFHCSGNRKKEWEMALALLDISFSPGNKRIFKKWLEAWYDSCATMQAESHIVCMQIRHKGILQDIRQPAARLANFITQFQSSPVVSERIRQEKPG